MTTAAYRRDEDTGRAIVTLTPDAGYAQTVAAAAGIEPTNTLSITWAGNIVTFQLVDRTIVRFDTARHEYRLEPADSDDYMYGYYEGEINLSHCIR